MAFLDILKGIGGFVGDVTAGAAQASENLPAAMQIRYQNQLRQQQLEQQQQDRVQQQEAYQREQMFKSFDLLKTLAESGDIEGASQVQADLVRQGLLPPESTFAASIMGKKTKKKVAEVSEKYGGVFYDDGSFEAMPADVIARAAKKPGVHWFDPKTGTIVSEDGTVIDLGDSWRALRGAEENTGLGKEVGSVFGDALKALDSGEVPPDVAMADAKLKLEIMGLSPSQIEEISRKWEDSFAQRTLRVDLTAEERKKIAYGRELQETANKLLTMLQGKPELERSMGRLAGTAGRVLSNVSKEAARTPEEVAFYATLENMRDILKRSRTGMAVTSTEEQFYQDLLGSQLTDPKAFKVRMEEAINREDLGARARYETALEMRRGGRATPEELKRIPSFKKGYKPLSGVRSLEKEIPVEEVLSHKAAKASGAAPADSLSQQVGRKWRWDGREFSPVEDEEE